MRAWTTALVVLGLSLSGCTKADNADPVIKAGTCIAEDVADANDRAPELSSVVDCSQPHVYEVLAVIDLPAAALAGETQQEKLANRTDLATVDQKKPSSRKRAFTSFTDRRCAIALQEFAGYDAVELGSTDARAAMVVPVLAGSVTVPWVNVSPKEQWLNDERQAICSARFSAAQKPGSTAAAPAKSVSSTDSKPIIAKASTPHLPVSLRQCTSYDAKGTRTLTSCDRRHYSEILFNFSAKAVMGQEFVDAVDPDSLTDEQYAELDKICAPALASVMRKGFNGQAVQARATLGSRWDAQYQTAACELTAVDSRTTDLGPGSLAWTDASAAKLIPVK